jgi:hypothetical protein
MSRQVHFSNLPLYEKVKKLYFEGEFIMAIRYYKYKINLYLYQDFYVEVFYNPKEDRVDKIEIFNVDSSRVKFYADQIKLPVDLMPQNR